MRKRVPGVLWILCAIVLLVSCAEGTGADPANHKWEFRYVQKIEDGMIVYCAESVAETYPQAEILELSCNFDRGVLMLRRDSDFWAWNYTLTDDSGETVLFDLTDTDGGTKKGSATVGITTYDDGSAEYTLLLRFEEYAIGFVDRG